MGVLKLPKIDVSYIYLLARVGLVCVRGLLIGG
jgi:hypothetical protein